MNPFVKVVPEVHEMVFQHFSAKYFQEVTKVSPTWDEIFGRSPAIMRKVKLNYCQASFSRVPKRIIELTSTRRYRNVSLFFAFHRDSNRNEMFRRHLEYFASLGPLTELSVDHFCSLSVPEEKMLLEKIDFSELQVLLLRYNTSEVINEQLSRCNSLVKVEVAHLKSTDKKIYSREIYYRPSIPSLIPFLERNHRLEEICLKGDGLYRVVFGSDISEKVHFRLKRLRIETNDIPELIPEHIERNFFKFLVKQSESLENLCIHKCRSEVVEHVFNKMPSLTVLNINNFEPDYLQLNLNTKIVELGSKNLKTLKKSYALCQKLRS